MESAPVSYRARCRLQRADEVAELGAVVTGLLLPGMFMAGAVLATGELLPDGLGVAQVAGNNRLPAESTTGP
jgi:hypothetical protein